MTTKNTEWIAALEKLRFDIVRREPLQAHKESGEQSSADISVSAEGQVRLVLTRQLGNTTKAKIKSRTKREYTIYRENNAVTIVNCRLNAGEDLGELVTEIEQEIGR